jgi:hypothetical protein
MGWISDYTKARVRALRGWSFRDDPVPTVVKPAARGFSSFDGYG